MALRQPEQCLCTALRQAARRVSQHYDAALGPSGLSANQFSILSRLEQHGSTTIHALAAALVMDRSTLGHLLRPLGRRGLVVLAMSDRDRRRREVCLTAAGVTAIAQVRPLWRAAQDRFEAAYGTDAACALRADLRAICNTEPT